MRLLYCIPTRFKVDFLKACILCGLDHLHLGKNTPTNPLLTLMAGDMSSVGCAALKKSSKLKLSSDKENNASFHNSVASGTRKENGHLAMKPPNVPPQNMRGGLRVYKIVILGDGGVGKSGKYDFFSLNMHYLIVCCFSRE